MTAVQTYVNALLLDAKCFRCLPEATQWEVQTYLLAFIAGYQNVDPNALALAAKAMSRLSPQTLLELKAFLLAFMNQTGTDPDVMIANARCFDCIPLGMQMDAQTYLLAQDPNGPGITDPNALALAAKSFQALSETTLLEIQVWLMAGIAKVSQDPNELAALNKCTKCVPLPMLSAIASQSLEYMEPIPADSARNGQPPPPVDDGGGGTGGGRGGGIPVCRDVPANLIPVLTPSYLAETLKIISTRLPKVCCHPDHIDFYEADDTSGTGAVLYATLAVGATHPGQANYITALNVAIQPTKAYVLAKQVCADGSQSEFSNAILSSNDGIDWAARVVVNGGAVPSANSINAITTFVTALKTAGVWNKINTVNVVAPDNLIAALTPLKVGLGLDPWGSIGPYVAGDLTVNGLKGDGVQKRMYTNISTLALFGASPTNIGTGAIYVSQETNDGKNILGAGTGGVDKSFFLRSIFNPNQAYSGWPYEGGGIGVIQAASPNGGVGYWMLTRTANNLATMYRAKSTVPHASMGTAGVILAADYRDATYILCVGGTHNATPSANRVSFGMFSGEGWTQAQSLALYNAIQALRTAFGGGFV